MCKFCEKEISLLETERISASNWGWGYDNVIKLTLTEAEEDQIKEAVFVDRGYLRLVSVDDCQCMDAGLKIKINFCPMCGIKI